MIDSRKRVEMLYFGWVLREGMDLLWKVASLKSAANRTPHEHKKKFYWN